MKTCALLLSMLLLGSLAFAAAPTAGAANWCVWLQDRSCDGLACHYGTEPDTCVHRPGPDDLPVPCRDWHCPDPDFP